MTNNNSDLEKDLFNLKNNLDDDTSYSPFNSLAYFVILSVIYTIIMVANINSQSSIENISVAENNKIYLLIYIFLLFGGYNYINTKVYQSYCKGVVDSTTTFNIFSMTLIPWVVIFGSIYFLLELFPGWIDPFANTIGYFLISFIGLKDILKKILPQNSKNPSIIEALKNINGNQSMLVNEIDSDYDEFNKFIKLSVKEGIFKNTSNPGNKDIDKDEIDKNSQFIKLYALIKSKFFIGKIIWFILAGLIISSISYNFVINLSCNKNIATESALIKNIYENDKPKFDGKKWRKYTTKTGNPQLFQSDITERFYYYFKQDDIDGHITNDENVNGNEITISQSDYSEALQTPGEKFEIFEGEYIEINGVFYIPIY